MIKKSKEQNSGEMRTIFTILFFATASSTAYSQFNQTTANQKIEKELSPIAVTYRLFPTQNMWTFIKLNTRNGQMWQVQYDVQGNNRFVTYLNLLPLVTTDDETDDRFTLYPTQNFHTFILLDQLDGKIWQVQWSIEAENRVILPIE